MTELQPQIEAAFLRRSALSPESAEPELGLVLEQTLLGLANGHLRVAEKIAGEWVLHSWLKKALLLSAQLKVSEPLVQASIEQGAYVASSASLTSCSIQTGAYIDAESHLGFGSRIGHCAQIGPRVHLAEGVGICGQLEPVSVSPTIIEEACYIGARCEIGEGVVIEKGAVLDMGLCIGAATRVYEPESGKTYYGRVPAGSVVVAGSLPSSCGRYSLNAAIIVKRVDLATRDKLGIQPLLRGAE